MWIIDFEYSGNNDPCFELGNIASESHVAGAAVVVLILLFIPDNHQSMSFVFTERINNSGYSD